jgi:hypothetical protein
MEVDMQFLRRHRPTPALVISVVALVIALGGVASATIPGDNGEIHACYNAQGALRVIDPAGGGSCPAGDKSLSWNAGEGLGRDTEQGLRSTVNFEPSLISWAFRGLSRGRNYPISAISVLRVPRASTRGGTRTRKLFRAAHFKCADFASLSTRARGGC